MTGAGGYLRLRRIINIWLHRSGNPFSVTKFISWKVQIVVPCSAHSRNPWEWRRVDYIKVAIDQVVVMCSVVHMHGVECSIDIPLHGILVRCD
jgi:hypothetical protein